MDFYKVCSPKYTHEFPLVFQNLPSKVFFCEQFLSTSLPAHGEHLFKLFGIRWFSCEICRLFWKCLPEMSVTYLTSLLFLLSTVWHYSLRTVSLTQDSSCLFWSSAPFPQPAHTIPLTCSQVLLFPHHGCEQVFINLKMEDFPLELAILSAVLQKVCLPSC